MKILVTVITPLGSFNGWLEYVGELNYEVAIEFVNSISQSINDLERLTIRHDDGTETIFGQSVLANAIVQVKIEDAPDEVDQ